MKIFLLIIALIYVSIISCYPIPRERTLYNCDQELSFGAQVHIFLMKLIGKHGVVDVKKKQKCEIIKTSYISSSELEYDDDSPFRRFKVNK